VAGNCIECGGYSPRGGICNVCKQSKLIQQQTSEIRRSNDMQNYLIQQQVAIDMEHKAKVEEEARLVRIAQEQVAYAEQQKVQILTEKEMSDIEAYNRGFNLIFSCQLSDVFAMGTLNENGYIQQLFFNPPFLIDRLNTSFKNGVFARVYNEFGGATGPGIAFMKEQAQVEGYKATKKFDDYFKDTGEFLEPSYLNKREFTYRWTISCPTSIPGVKLETQEYACNFVKNATYSVTSDGTLNIQCEKLFERIMPSHKSDVLAESFVLGVKAYLADNNDNSNRKYRLSSSKIRFMKYLGAPLLFCVICFGLPLLTFWYFFPIFFIQHWMAASAIWVSIIIFFEFSS
jgi:hypothetical protein